MCIYSSSLRPSQTTWSSWIWINTIAGKIQKGLKKVSEYQKVKNNVCAVWGETLLKLLVLYRQQWHRKQFMRTGDRRCSPTKMQRNFGCKETFPRQLCQNCRSFTRAVDPATSLHDLKSSVIMSFTKVLHVQLEKCYNPLKAHFSVSVI